ncbi:hypothetical protein L873DRAFT_1806857 [Choiromyces venosus 120613-1]|uniref:Uncharacterized protein n=1 Tax=Choiromyces venosus 120613-1 TaxID=1336337 RepID=A0A3N4JM55_9PEZI|nr:hypothetical protein L873DRAFT_1806857 [Choiromyces venosus 120613-1]
MRAFFLSFSLISLSCHFLSSIALQKMSRIEQQSSSIAHTDTAGAVGVPDRGRSDSLCCVVQL